jgi:Fe-S-cluster-containing hydrogenase component 2
MADFLDELIGLQKEFQAITGEISDETAFVRGATVDESSEPVWTPSDYKVVPKGNSAMCVRCKKEDASCDLCLQVCPTDSIFFDDDGALEIKSDCRKCGLCVAACPTDALVSSLHAPKMVYDKICKAAEANEMVYVTCTRALGHVPEAAQVVLPCVGAISAEVWYAILCEYGNVGIYLPRGICDKCRTTTGEECYTDAISLGESWSGENVDLVERERDMVLEVDHQAERKAFVNGSLKSLGMTASKVNPLTAKLARGAEKLAKHSKQITELQKSLDRLAGAKSTVNKKRVLTNTRQLMLVALANHPDTAGAILLDAPQSTDKCDCCGECADACPMSAIDIVDGGVQVLTTHCVACALCSDVCPQGAIEFVEVDGNRLIVDDPETKKKVEADEKAKKQQEENREKAKKYGQKMLDMFEKEADEAEARGEKLD